MENKIAFHQAKAAYLKTLKQYVPVVAKVHGKTHPEFHQVHRLFDALEQKIREAGANKPDLDEVFAKLRDITNNYTVPDDVCETYEAVYHMLGELDKAYQA